MRFPVVLHTDDGVSYGVIVPDLPGCFSAGDTLDEALDSALEAIDLHVQGLLEDGHKLPAVQTVAAHKANPEYADGLWAVVDAPVERYLGPAEKLNITLPRLLLAQIDDYTASHNLTRSGFLAKAAITAMQAKAIQVVSSAATQSEVHLAVLVDNSKSRLLAPIVGDVTID